MKARLLAVMAVVAVGAMAGISPAVAKKAHTSATKTVPAVVKVKRFTIVTLQQCSGGTQGCGGWMLEAGSNPKIAKVSSVRQSKLSGSAPGSTITYYVKVTGVKKGKTAVAFSNAQGTTEIKIKVVTHTPPTPQL